MIQKICVIGIGSLGGFLCNHISYVSFVNELVVIDPDIVETSNVEKSIYDIEDVGKLKVDAIEEKLRKSVKITKLPFIYREGETKIPKCDLVVDCRDLVCTRKGEIDVKFYISEKSLIIDCKKRVKYCKEYPGSYIMKLPKDVINDAAFLARKMIVDGTISELIQRNIILRIDLDDMTDHAKKDIEELVQQQALQDDIMYDPPPGIEKLRELEPNIKPILELSKQKNLPVYVGEKSTWKRFASIASSAKYEMIKRGELQNEVDVITKLSKLVKTAGGDVNFIVTINKRDGDTRVELIQEAGSA